LRTHSGSGDRSVEEPSPLPPFRGCPRFAAKGARRMHRPRYGRVPMPWRPWERNTKRLVSASLSLERALWDLTASTKCCTAIPHKCGYRTPALIKPGSRKRTVLDSGRPGYRWNMMLDFPDGTLRREQDLWREKLEAAQSRYESDRNEESRAELRRALKTFADLVMNGRMPRDLA
jgi:hypothetical protein